MPKAESVGLVGRSVLVRVREREDATTNGSKLGVAATTCRKRQVVASPARAPVLQSFGSYVVSCGGSYLPPDGARRPAPLA